MVGEGRGRCTHPRKGTGHLLRALGGPAAPDGCPQWGRPSHCPLFTNRAQVSSLANPPRTHLPCPALASLSGSGLPVRRLHHPAGRIHLFLCLCRSPCPHRPPHSLREWSPGGPVGGSAGGAGTATQGKAFGDREVTLQQESLGQELGGSEVQQSLQGGYRQWRGRGHVQGGGQHNPWVCPSPPSGRHSCQVAAPVCSAEGEHRGPVLGEGMGWLCLRSRPAVL